MEPRAEDERGRTGYLEGDGTEAANIDDEELEELHNSLKEIVQDPSVKPRLQCLMVDPSFSMVTVQSEDSGIVWETASSRCSTPWASEASSPSDAYSIEGSGTQGNIVIIMDEDKIKRRKKTSSRGKLGDRFRRRLSGAAIGEERPAMIEVSVPNIRPEHPEDGQSAESKPDKDQELFNLISEGFEILNIVVPSKLPTVDEEDVTELADNLSYLEDTPKIKSKCKLENTAAVTSPEGEAIDSEETKDESQKDLSQASTDEQPKKDETDLDYLEKFTLLDENAPGDVSEKLEPVEDVPVIEEPQVPQPKEKVEDKLDEDSFVIITDVEIADEHLDEVFYGASCDKEPKLPSHAKADEGHIDKESSKTLKECGSTLFGSQECILTPVYLPSGPPKIIDQDLLDEPRAMSFHYSDLYEDAIGERKKDDDFSDVESVISEKSFKRRYSDSDDADGYLEKFILKDDTPVVKDIVEEDTTDSDRMIWPQSKFEMTGCLIRVKEETEPQEEDVHVSQANLEGRQDAIDRQIQTPGSVEGCEDAEKLKTGCVSVKSASEDCGTETGCVVATVVSHDELSQTAGTMLEPVKQKKDIPLRLEDRQQSEVKVKHESSCVPESIVQDKVTKIKGKSQTHEKTSSVTNEVYKLTESTVEIDETIFITKEEPSVKSETQEKVKPEVVVEAGVKETSVSATGSGNSVPQEVGPKELPVDVNEFTGIVLEKVEEETKPLCGKTIGPVASCETEVTSAVLDCNYLVTENREVPAVVEEELRAEDEMQEQTTDTVVPERASHLVPTKIGAEDIVVKGEIETISEQKAMEGLQTSEIDAATRKIEEITVEVLEKAKQVNESMEDTVPALESKLPAGDGVTIMKASVASAVERLNEVAKDVHTTEERVSVEEPKEMDKDELKQELPIGDNKMLERSEGRDVEGYTVSTDKHSQDTSAAPPTAPEVPETDLLPAVVLPPLLGEEVSKKEKHEPADVDVDTHTVTTEAHITEESSKVTVLPPVAIEVVANEIRDAAVDTVTPEAHITEESSKVTVLPPVAIAVVANEIQDAAVDTVTTEAHITEESSKVTVLPPVAIAVVANEIQDAAVDTVTTEAHITEESSKVTVLPPVAIEVVANEIREAAVDTTLQESIGQVPEPVSRAAVDAANEVEGKPEKSRKVLLRDTHKENLWRTVEPTTPSPPKEMQDSTLMRVSPLEHLEYIRDNDEDFVVGGKLTSDTGLFSTLRSFSPQEDLSGFGRDTAELDVNKDTIEEIDYEMVTKEDAKQSGSEVTVDKEELVHEKSAEQTIEESYEFIEDLDSAQTSEPRCLIEEVEIQPMDAFCLACRCPILMSDSGHQSHEVSTLDKAYDDIKTQLSNWISMLQERSENIEDMVSELELAYNSVEEHCKDSEKAMDEQNEEVLKLVMDQYNEMSQTMEDEKKVKLEQLYDQIVSFQANIDSAKETMEKTTAHLEETDELAFASSFKDINTRLKTALESTMSLELGPRGLLVFEDYAKGTTGNEKKNRQVIPVPQQPHLQPQEANSATSTSVTVYWTINQGDIIDCFQVYCMEEPQGVISEEYRVTVKESYCTLEELEPDKCYKVWVMAVNYTGCSLPSERLPFRTAPSVPVIQPEACTVLWDSAILRWSSAQPSAVDSFTLEYCRQYAVEGEGLRSVSGIKGYEHKVLLQPNENFLFYIKSVNSAGASEQSEAALISTRATRFLLLSETANPVLKVSENRTSVEYPVETYNEMFSLIECPSVMGEILPLVGFHYWETVVAGCTAYRIGVAYKTAPKDSTVGDNSASWCLHCVPTSISCRFELLHDNVESDIFVIDVPVRIGTLLDFTQGRLVFFNAQNGQCLGSFQQTFSQPCYPVFVLERAGSLELKMTTEVPEFAKHW